MKRFWIPAAALALVVVAGILGYLRLRAIVAERMRQELTVILDVSVDALRLWANQQSRLATAVASMPELQRAAADLYSTAMSGQVGRGSESAETFTAVLQRAGYDGWVIFGEDGEALASNVDSVVNLERIGAHVSVRTVFEDRQTRVSLLRRDDSLTSNREQPQRGVPVMILVTPISMEGEAVRAALVLPLRSEQDLTALLSTGRLGASGETYAFDRDGRMVSQSRYDAQLRRLGLLPANDTTVTSVLNVDVRDPGGNLLFGFVPDVPRSSQPLTRMAAAATSGESGVDVRGYRDYRGVDVVGAWRWIPELDLGVTTEVDRDEAIQGLIAVQRGFWGLVTLLLTGVLGLFLYSRAVTSLRSRVEQAERIGQYQLERKLGAGGMGTVYLARHALLRRPTAVKLIRSAEVSELLVQRFEREVQYTSRLSHPNTIAVYDYGRTPNQVFYYAMEYVDGISLEELVAESGPVPDGRVVHLLNQICGSLAEAHNTQLIHRDVKPANIMLGVRGGVPDFVKVLDFGLVREIEQPEGEGLTQAGAVTGTPMYMPPEAVTGSGIDERSDIYALGAVAYFLITGTPPFVGNSVVEICAKHLHATPEPLSSRLGKPVSPDLERLVLTCLEKNPNDRPANATALAAALRSCVVWDAWSAEQASRWWRAREARPAVVGDESAADTTVASSGESDIPSYFNVEISEGRWRTGG